MDVYRKTEGWSPAAIKDLVHNDYRSMVDYKKGLSWLTLDGVAAGGQLQKNRCILSVSMYIEEAHLWGVTGRSKKPNTLLATWTATGLVEFYRELWPDDSLELFNTLLPEGCELLCGPPRAMLMIGSATLSVRKEEPNEFWYYYDKVNTWTRKV